MSTGEKYVAAAYLVVFAAVLLYVVLIALKLGRLERELAALAELSPEHRAVIVLRHLLEYTPGEISRILELPRGTVNSRLRRGLDELAELLEPEEDTL